MNIRRNEVGMAPGMEPCDSRETPPRARWASGWAMAVLCLACWIPGVATAHGGLSMDDDKCKLTLGPYSLHFAGYQPLANGNQEFCEDIPQTGKTVVVMDMVDDVLREMPIEVRIIKDIGDESKLDAITVVHLPAKVYPTGSIPLEYDFDQAGRYVGLVVGGDQRQFVSRFPFSVGEERVPYGRYLLILAVPLIGLALYRASARARESAAKAGS